MSLVLQHGDDSVGPYLEIHPVDNLVINGGSARLRRNLAE
jgi:hypothetical protein